MFTVTKFGRFARNMAEAHNEILADLSGRGGSVYDWNDPFGRLVLQTRPPSTIVARRPASPSNRAVHQDARRGPQGPVLRPAAASRTCAPSAALYRELRPLSWGGRIVMVCPVKSWLTRRDRARGKPVIAEAGGRSARAAKG
ncbi:unnamed protein product [[Actinomadura] parvosata subsp. kistnae]|uniref:hypothetical protein n=1 Tax=[Actinomadura] parvosata TaxID=1955412 RepID=UPI000D2BF6B7|nr:hypothetical protein [Nonomuraea sp. ATCC 55076]SPL88606.1 unnamed protein product [Actinomadura parvosata subsp. kistnae]